MLKESGNLAFGGSSASNVDVSSGTKLVAINNSKEAVKDECRLKFAKKSANDMVVVPNNPHHSNYPLPSMEFTGTNNNSNGLRKPVVKVSKRGFAEAFQKQSSSTSSRRGITEIVEKLKPLHLYFLRDFECPSKDREVRNNLEDRYKYYSSFPYVDKFDVDVTQDSFDAHIRKLQHTDNFLYQEFLGEANTFAYQFCRINPLATGKGKNMLAATEFSNKYFLTVEEEYGRPGQRTVKPIQLSSSQFLPPIHLKWSKNNNIMYYCFCYY